MKQLKVTTLISQCSNCPHSNIWALYCNKHKRKFNDMDDNGIYVIPEWCELSDLNENEEFNPDLLICYPNNGRCCGAACHDVDHETSSMTKSEIKFKCKHYNVWLVRRD